MTADQGARLASTIAAHTRVSEHDPALGPCWEWTRARNDRGYGVMADETGRQEKVHRLAWRIYFGAIAPGLSIMHICDNRSCWRPGHLAQGTQTENIRDRHLKGRDQRGERHWHATLTEALVREIRARRSAGETVRAIAADLRVSEPAVHHVLAGRTWMHVPA